MASLSHTQAARIIGDAWRRVHGRAPTLAERVYTQAIAYLETGYGRAAQFGPLADRGYYNWGALQTRAPVGGECPTGTVPGSDQGSVCFYVYRSDDAAAEAFIRTLTTRHWPVVAAMRGSPEDVARAMRVPPVYYVGTTGSNEDRIARYASAIRGAIGRIGERVPSGGAVASVLPWLLVAAAGYGAYRYLGPPRRRG